MLPLGRPIIDLDDYKGYVGAPLGDPNMKRKSSGDHNVVCNQGIGSNFGSIKDGKRICLEIYSQLNGVNPLKQEYKMEVTSHRVVRAQQNPGKLVTPARVTKKLVSMQSCQKKRKNLLNTLAK